jgi:hypothetical protein
MNSMTNIAGSKRMKTRLRSSLFHDRIDNPTMGMPDGGPGVVQMVYTP